MNTKNNQQNIGTVNNNQQNIRTISGDTVLENFYNNFNNNTIIEPTQTFSNIYKKDFAIIVNENNTTSEIIKYGIYAVLYKNITYVINLIQKKNMIDPIITYSESQLDPSIIIDIAYKYEKNKNRPIYLKRYLKQTNNPSTFLSYKTDISYTKDIIINDINDDLIDLYIIIANNKYISKEKPEKLFMVASLLNLPLS